MYPVSRFPIGLRYPWSRGGCHTKGDDVPVSSGLAISNDLVLAIQPPIQSFILVVEVGWDLLSRTMALLKSSMIYVKNIILSVRIQPLRINPLLSHEP